MTGVALHEPLSGLIVCTRNRPREVSALLEALRACPDAPPTLIVDSSGTDETQTAVEDFVAMSRHPSVRYLRVPAGLTLQRTLAVRSLPPDTRVVHFLDDDAIPEPGYFTSIESVFASDGEIVGVGGLVTNAMPLHASSWRRLFLLDSTRPGALLRSGVNVRVGAVSRLTPVDWLSGCCMSYRRDVFSSLSFDIGLRGDGLGEDLDFSFRAKHLGRLCVTPHARVEHRQSPTNRMTADAWWAAEVARRHEFVLGAGADATSRPAFWWSVAGELILCFTEALLRGRRSSARKGFALLGGALSVLRP